MSNPSVEKGALRAFYKSLIAKTRGKAALAALLQLALTSAQGLGLISILPLLYLSGQAFEDKAPSGALVAIAHSIESLGLTLKLSNILLIYAAAIIALAAARRYHAVFSDRLQQSYIGDLGLDLIKAINAAPWPVLSKIKHSKITQTLSDDLKQVHLATALSFQLFGAFSLLIVNLTVACFLSINLVLPSLLVMGFLWLVLKPLHRKSSRLGETLRNARERFFELLSTNLSGLKLIRIHSKESVQNRQFEAIRDETIEQAHQFRKSHSAALWLFESGAVIALALFIYAAIEWVELPTPSLLLLIIIYARSLPMLSRAQQSWQMLLHAMPSFNAYQKSLQSFVQSSEEHSNERPEAEKTIWSLNQSICIDRLSFSHEERSIIEALSLEIQAKQTTALIGESGAGKSTLADLICGLHKPNAGRILIDEAELTQSNASAWRTHIAYVPQENVLFHTSIRNNFLWANPQATDTEISTALQTANAHSIIDQLPDGLDTIVGERGSLLSGGERQRIALARALVAHPKLLILDEATNALDKKSESQIREAIGLLHGELTVIIITHDPAVTTMADRIYRIENRHANLV